MNNKGFDFAPVIVLVAICLVASLLLAGTYEVTKPIIAEINEINANITRGNVLPTADAFEEIVLSEDSMIDGVTEVYRATNGTGIVVTAINKGFGGGVAVMTGIDSEGNVTGVEISDHAETPGLGTKAMTPDHLGKFKGHSEITDSEDGDGAYIDAITGATYSSNAIFNGVDEALAQFAELGGAI